MEPIVEFKNAGVSLGGNPVLRDLDLTVEAGEAVGIAGPNGSGKTTLARTAATLQSVDRGVVTVLGKDSSDPDLTATRRSIGFIGHQPAVIPELTLEENLRHIARLAGIDETRVGRALDVVGLAGAARRRADASSFGMCRRVEIAHLLLTRPKLVLLDEAASGLDDSARDLIDTLVRSVRERGGGCLVVSHDRRQLETLTSTMFTLVRGRLEMIS